jgi:hypothetical protein
MANQWQEEEDRDWLRAEALLESSTVEEMLFFGANAGGMLVWDFLWTSDIIDNYR